MIFVETWRQVLNGTKTQTRRLNRGLYKEGKTYAVQPSRGKPSVGRIRITGIWQRPLGRTTEMEALAEGFTTREEFFEVFAQVNRLPKTKTWVIGSMNVWVFEFELVAEEPMTK